MPAPRRVRLRAHRARLRGLLDLGDLEGVRHLLQREVVALEVDVDGAGQAGLGGERRVGGLGRGAGQRQHRLGRDLHLPLE